MDTYESFTVLRKAAIAFGFTMQEKSRWDMYEQTILFMQQYCLDDEAGADALQEAADAFVQLRREYLTSQMELRALPLHQTKANKAFLEEYSKIRKN